MDAISATEQRTEPNGGDGWREVSHEDEDVDAFGGDFTVAQRRKWSVHYLNYAALTEFLLRTREWHVAQRRAMAELRGRHKQFRSADELSALLFANDRGGGGGGAPSSFIPDGGPAAPPPPPVPIPETDEDHPPRGLMQIRQGSYHQSAPGNLHELAKFVAANRSMPSSPRSPTAENSYLVRKRWRPRGDSVVSQTSDGCSSGSGTSGSHSSRGIRHHRAMKPDQIVFCSMLDEEVEKVGLFYLAEQGRIASALQAEFFEQQRRRRRLGDGSRKADVASDVLLPRTSEVVEGEVDEGGVGDAGAGKAAALSSAAMEAVASDLLNLFRFIAVNATALRKVLDRHDAIIRRVGGRAPLLHEWYVRTRTEDDGGRRPSHLRTLLRHDGLTALVGTLREMWEQQQQKLLSAGNDGTVQSDRGAFLADIDVIATKMKKAEHRSFNDYVVEGSLGNNIALEPSILTRRFSYADMTQDDADMHFFAVWQERRREMIEITPTWKGEARGELELLDLVDEASGGKPSDLDGGWTWRQYFWPLGLQLNLLSTFLYMTNYFIAGPTSVRYMDALGGDKALAGMLIGATPWAVMLSTLLFSLWTNFSFRGPLICSGALLCVGNLMYALALKFSSIELVLAGRMMIGLGGPRVINRRFIADTATLRQRTAVSAAFVTFSASGVAVGPGLAVLLQHENLVLNVPLLGPIVLNGLTSPGYFMFLVWLVFLVVVLVSFEEPHRIGLEEQPVSTIGSESDHSLPDALASDKDANAYVSQPANDDANMSQSSPNKSLPQSVTDGVNVETTGIRHRHYGSVQDSESGADPSFAHAPDLKPELEEEEAEQEEDDSNTSDRCCLHGMTWPVRMCMFLLFVNKLSIESLISSSPIITENKYDWNVHRIGALGVGIGMLVIPLSMCIGWLSRKYDDGQLLLWLLYFTAAGLFLLLDLSSPPEKDVDEGSHTSYGLLGVGPHRYIYGCLFSFSGLQAMESIIMSTLSKVVPYSLAVGTCNSGLINTEIGTFGRAFGDLVVTCLGLVDLDGLLTLLVTPLLMLVIGCIVLVRLNYVIFST